MNALLSHTWTIQVAIFTAASSAVWLLISIWNCIDSRVLDRMQTLHTGDAPREDPRRLRFSPLEDGMNAAQLPTLARHLIPTDERERLKLQARLIRAGKYQPISMIAFSLGRAGAMLLPPLIAVIGTLCQWWNWNQGFLFGALIGGAGIVLPGFWLDQQIIRRQTRLRRALPDFLDLFVACVESGMTLQSTIVIVTEELRAAHPDLADEFAVCCRQVQFGHSLEAAMRDLAERTGLEELRSLSSFVQQAQRYGTTMANALGTLAETLRTQRELRAEEMAQKAAVKILVPTLLFIFPAVFVVLAAPAAISIHESFSHPAPEVEQKAK